MRGTKSRIIVLNYLKPQPLVGASVDRVQVKPNALHPAVRLVAQLEVRDAKEPVRRGQDAHRDGQPMVVRAGAEGSHGRHVGLLGADGFYYRAYRCW